MRTGSNSGDVAVGIPFEESTVTVKPRSPETWKLPEVKGNWFMAG
jgi:hypothetical protein